MAFKRVQIESFELANDAYKNASVTFYVVNAITLLQTETLATLYTGISGSSTVANPQVLDGSGKFAQPVYVEQACIGVVSDSEIENHSTGIIYPPNRGWEGEWQSSKVYLPGDLVKDSAAGANTKNYYICITAHESGTWATDLSAGYWGLVIEDVTTLVEAAEASAASAAADAAAADSDAISAAADAAAADLDRIAAQAAKVAAEAARDAAIAATGSVKVTANDTTASVLNTALLVSSSSPLTKTVNNPSGDETLTLGINMGLLSLMTQTLTRR